MTVYGSHCVGLIPVGHTEVQLALQSSCIMLSNNAKPPLSLSLGFSSGALTFTPRVKSIILTLLLKMQCHD